MGCVKLLPANNGTGHFLALFLEGGLDGMHRLVVGAKGWCDFGPLFRDLQRLLEHETIRAWLRLLLQFLERVLAIVEAWSGSFLYKN